MKNIVLTLLILSVSYTINAQYTETINSNLPGKSMGAYAVGKGVFQMENSFEYKQQKYDNSKNMFQTMGYSFRYGIFHESLEWLWQGGISRKMIDEKVSYSWLPQTMGFKYLIYNYLFDSKPNIYSWKANHSVQWKRWIPSISLCVLMVLDEREKSFPDGVKTIKGITPAAVVSFQSQLLDDTVFLLNIKGNYLTQSYREIGYIVSFTHNINYSRWSCFVENEGIFSKGKQLYFLRAGVAYLLGRNAQINWDWELGLKKAPRHLGSLIGVSYRFDKKRYAKLLSEEK